MPIEHNDLTLDAIKNLDRNKIVVIIGAGPAGLVSALYALRNGLCPVVLESTSTIGGIWRHGTWQSMQTNLSKFSLFSDLECSDDMPMFLSADNMLAYLNEYAEKFDLYKYIIFNAKVTQLRIAAENLKCITVNIDGEESTIYTDNVIVASGFFGQANLPALPGLKQFKNSAIHSSNYQTRDFVAKDVVIIGNGFSAVDIAAEAARQAKTVTHIIEKPFWILPRYMPLPLDLHMASYKRFGRKTLNEVTLRTPSDYQKANTYLSGLCAAQTQKCNPLYIDPNSTQPPFVAISDQYMQHVQQNNIRIQYGKVARFTSNGLQLQGKEQTIPADNVIFCTGYNATLPFLNPDILQTIKFSGTDRFQSAILHKGMLHPDLPGIAFVGMYRGPYFTIMELMARLACGLFAGNIKISRDEMQQGLHEATLIREQRPRPQFPHGDFVGFATDLASTIGCAPNLDELQKTKPALHQHLLHAPVTASDFRIFGPHAAQNTFLRKFEKMQDAIAPIEPKHPMFVKTPSCSQTLASLARTILTKGPKF